MRSLRALLLILAMLAGLVPTARAYCLKEVYWLERAVRVVLYDQDNDGYFVGLPVPAVERALVRALESWNENGMANIRMEYHGLTTDPGALPHYYYIVVREQTNCNGCWPSNACQNEISIYDFIRRSDVWLVYNPRQCSQVRWDFYPYTEAPDVLDLQGALTHELGHALGLHHPTRCNSGATGGAMGGGSSISDRRNISRDDIAGLVARYGWLQGEVDYKESYNGLSWMDGSSNIPGATANSPVSSASSSAEPWGTLAYLNASDHGGLPFVKYHQAHYGAYTWPQFVAYQTSWDVPATAHGAGRELVAFFVEDSPVFLGRKIRYCLRQGGGLGSWVCHDALGNDGKRLYTRRDGLTASYDATSGRFLIAFRGDDNSETNLICRVNGNDSCDDMHVFTLRPDLADGHPAVSGRVTDLDIKSIDAPGVACRSSGGSNCLLAWGSVTGNACLHFGHGFVQGDGSFHLSNDLYQCYHIYQTPHLAVDEHDADYPFRLAFRQGGPYVFTMRKSASPWSYWRDLRAVHVAPQPYGASIGTTLAHTWLWWTPFPFPEQHLFYTKPTF